MPKVIFLAPDLSTGGLQRHLVRLANALVSQGFEIEVITYGSGMDLAEELDEAVVHTQLRGRSSEPRLHLTLYMHLREQDDAVLVGWSIYPSLILCLLKVLGLKRTVVVTELNYPPLAYRFGSGFNSLEFFTRRLFRRAECVTANSDETVSYMRHLLPDSRVVSRIYNPVEIEVSASPEARFEEWERAPFRLLSVGRLLNRHKGFDVLIDAMPAILRKNKDAKLLILGEGPDREALERKISDLFLRDHIYLPGSVKKPDPYYFLSSVFVMPSHYEGFPNVLVEALMASCIAVASNCRTGPSELISDGESGFLFEPGNSDALASQVIQALSQSAADKARMRQRAIKESERFSVERSALKYRTDVIDRVHRTAGK